MDNDLFSRTNDPIPSLGRIRENCEMFDTRVAAHKAKTCYVDFVGIQGSNNLESRYRTANM